MKKIIILIFVFILFSGQTFAAQLIVPTQNQNDINIKSQEINDTVLSIGNNITIDSNIKGDLVVIGQNIYINGSVDGNIFAGGEQITINSKITKDVFAVAKNFSLSNSAFIEQNLRVRAKSMAIPNQNQIKGHISILKTSNQKPYRTMVLNTLTLLFTGFILLRWLPKTCQSLIEIGRKNWGKCILFGILFYILSAFVIAILLMSLIGIPIGLIFLAIFLLDLYLAQIASGYIIGNLLFKNQINRYFGLAFGVIIIQGIKLIPLFGSSIFTILYFYGFGSIVLTKISFISKIKKL